jgi:hypothetical protein
MEGRTLALLLVGIAVVLFAVAAHLVRRATRRLRAGGRAKGVIVGSEETFGSSGDNRPYYRPKVRFAARDGHSHTFVSPVGRGKPYANGANVDVVYDPANPEDAEIAGFVAQWLVPLALAAFGAFMLVYGVGLLSAH